MADFLQQVVSGLASGAIFASLALALVLIYRATDVVNFAQGEMATFSTYIAWSLMDHGMSYWPAFVLTLVISFLGGAAIERTLIRPVEHRPEIAIVIVTIGLLIALNGLTGWIWGAEVKAFDSPFPNEAWEIGNVAISKQDVGTLVITLLTVAALWAFFRFTKLGHLHGDRCRRRGNRRRALHAGFEIGHAHVFPVHGELEVGRNGELARALLTLDDNLVAVNGDDLEIPRLRGGGRALRPRRPAGDQQNGQAGHRDEPR